MTVNQPLLGSLMDTLKETVDKREQMEEQLRKLRRAEDDLAERVLEEIYRALVGK